MRATGGVNQARWSAEAENAAGERLLIEASAANVVAELPRDQALGLRLLCLARAAAAVHMGQACAVGGEDCAVGAAGGWAGSGWERGAEPRRAEGGRS